jgi:hypothetical protein
LHCQPAKPDRQVTVVASELPVYRQAILAAVGQLVTSR